ncbi:hypothetical protein PRZ48_008384 [Zasmidium cellare]|uniref:Uncharacterized protein n=1 Tax=Zasmidium cellare TaxID=395010 RepID=A0ABR0EGK3_ZASCE|nr:hypothetical protein PRZ48_008384 [Zasmidium cellare]
MDYVILKATCDGDTSTISGGTTMDTNYGVNITAELNPNYNPPSKKGKKRAAVSEQPRNHARSWSELERRDGGIIEDTFNNTQKADDMTAVTGRFPNGSSYMISEADSQMISIGTSVTVEAGFSDLSDASASLGVDASYGVTATTGVTVSVDCNAGQEGIIYLVPVYDEYYGQCVTDNNNPITVDVPVETQNNYIVQCLGDPS